MKRNLIAVLVVIVCAVLAAAQTITDPAHIEVYITPYYNSKGPVIDVGRFSRGLTANSEPEFVATISKMKQSWDTLNFAETYVVTFASMSWVSGRNQFTGFIRPNIAGVFLRV